MATKQLCKYEERVKVFCYEKSAEKQMVREFILSHIPSDCAKVLTLSADNFNFENMVLNSRFSKNPVIDSYEYKEDVYKKGLENFKKLKKEHEQRELNFYLGDIFSVDFKSYNFINLDLCGSFTIDLVNRLIISLQRGFNGTIFITMTKNVRNTLLRNHLDIYGVKTMQEFRDDVFPNLMKYYCDLDMFVEPLMYKNKSENTKATEMVLFGFKKVA
jgi:hypothetical protein